MIESLTIGTILCTDILFELFEYFYVDELFNSFHGPDYQFPLLLRKGNVKLHVRYLNAHFRKHILPHIERNNVISIRIANMYQMARINLNQFDQVRLLVLNNVTERNWPRYFPNNLKYLSICVRSKDRDTIFKKALGLDNIVRLEFNSTFLHFRDSHDILDKPSTIKHLVFKSQRCVLDYQFLINHMPCLQSLQSTNTYFPHRSNENIGKFMSLHTLDLVCKHMDFDEMIFFLTNVTVYTLRRCRLININSCLSPGIADILISFYFPDFSHLS